jgi:hypothetical protein
MSEPNRSKADLETEVATYRARALQEHDTARRWQNRALIAEEKLANHQCNSNPVGEGK